MKEYWIYFIRLKLLEGWSFDNGGGDYVLSSIYKDNVRIKYEDFVTVIREFYLESSIEIIKGSVLKFEYNLGSLRVIKTDRTPEQISFRNKYSSFLDKDIIEFYFYFCKDTYDEKNRRIHNIDAKTFPNFKLITARSNKGVNQKNLGFRHRLRYSVEFNKSLLELYDTKLINKAKHYEQF